MSNIRYVGVLAKYDDIIGVDNDLLMHCREDLQHFKQLTWNQTVVMGRATISSLPFKLPNRHVIGLTQASAFAPFHKADMFCTSVEHLEHYLNSNNIQDVYVCGGSQIYDLFADKISTWVVTEFDQVQIPNGNLTRLTDKTMDAINRATTLMTKRIDCGLISYKIGKSR